MTEKQAILFSTASSLFGRLTEPLSSGNGRLAGLLSAESVLEAEEAGLAVVVAEASLALLLAVDRHAGAGAVNRFCDIKKRLAFIDDCLLRFRF